MTIENQYIVSEDPEVIREQLDIRNQETIGIAQQLQDDHPLVAETVQKPALESTGIDFYKASEASPSPEKNSKRETLNNAGSLFKNERKSKAEHPDLTGNALVDGCEYWMSAWRKTGKSGDFYSISLRPKDAPAAAQELI